MSAKTNSSSKSGSSQGRTGSCQSDNTHKQQETRSFAVNGQVNEANKKRTAASQRYDSYRTAFYGTPAEKEAYR